MIATAGLSSIPLAALTGFISGLLLSIPPGPVNLTILNEGARRGIKQALIISLGAVTMEVTYCFIAFTGFSSLLNSRYIKAGMELFTFVFILYLGIKFLLAKSADAPVQLGPKAHRIEERIEQKLHPHSAFMTGFVRVMGNIGVLVWWIVFAANFISRDWVKPDWPDKLSCVGGVGAGTALWFVILSFSGSRGHGKFSEKTLLRMEHLSGIGLLILGLLHGGRIIWQMVHHQL